MAKYNIEDLYYDIYAINDYFYETEDGQLIVDNSHESIHDYCHYTNNSGKINCHNYLEMTNCSVIYLLKNLKKYGLEYDKFAEYAILWLSYILDQKQKDKLTDLNKFYTDHIVNNECYNNKIKDDDEITYKKIIDTNNDLMNMNINEISKFDRPFNILFNLYYTCNRDFWNCEKNLGYANSFVSEFEKLNNDSNINGNDSYRKLLSTLSNDYNNLKKIYYDKNNSCDLPSLSQLNLPKSSIENSLDVPGKDSEQTLGQPSYNIKDVYKEINTIDGYFREDTNGKLIVNDADKSIDNYCHSWSGLGKDNCHNYLEMTNCSVIYLLENLKKYGLGHDKLAEYIILLLSYKLNQHSKHSGTNLNDFYTDHIEKNDDCNNKIKVNGLTCKEIIDKKKVLMNNNEISKFNYPFSILCSLYKGIKKNRLDCTKYSIPANNFAIEFEKLNNDSNINGNDSYRKLLSTLSDDYNNLKNKYGNDESCGFPTLSPVKTSSSSSIAGKLIPGLSTFAIPAFLGIAYKYSLFGIDKLFQRQYIGKKLKKVKKKMNNYI
ncbi:hypothetical protein YYE_04576 [Plasmodium vinckei vinckei]|uniref:PIR protein CIR protein n=1 Tax=Plasmodium vinckei vinckei TaxID=54757 RepID=A0A081I9N5_PLAVN|nr:hypothetical protein YYE_04576 [Plasmodium vinckei vinckei]